MDGLGQFLGVMIKTAVWLNGMVIALYLSVRAWEWLWPLL